RAEPIVRSAEENLALQVNQRQAAILRERTQRLVELARAFELRLERWDRVEERNRFALEDQVERLRHVLAIVVERNAVLHVVDAALDGDNPWFVVIEHLLQRRQAALAALE